MKTHPKEQTCESNKGRRFSEKEAIKRTKTSNPKGNSPAKASDKQAEYSLSFCYEKKTPEEKILNLKEELNAKRNELYEALASEFRLKESIMGLEKHAQKLAIENKILQKNRRQSLNTLTVLQQIMNEMNGLRQENLALALKSKQMREGAIDALVEKERRILELTEEIQGTEQYYRSQLEMAREEIRMLQARSLALDAKVLDKQRTKELKLSLEGERRELLKRIEILEGELEEKEKESKATIMNLEKSLNEDNERKLSEQLKIIVERDCKLYSNSINILEKAEEKSNHYEIACLTLQEKIKSLEVERSTELVELRQKSEARLEQVFSKHREEMTRMSEDYERKLEELRRESGEALREKIEYIMQQQKSKDVLEKRLTELEADNIRKLTENNDMVEKMNELRQQNDELHAQIDGMVQKQENYIKDLQTKFDSERRILNFELKSIKRHTMDDSALLSPIKKPRKVSVEFPSKNATSKDQKRRSVAVFKGKHPGHSTSLGMELKFQGGEFFNFKNSITNNNEFMNSQRKIESNSPQSFLNNLRGEPDQEDLLAAIRGANPAFSEEWTENMRLSMQKVPMDKENPNPLFWIPNGPPVEPEGVMKVDETSSESDMSDYSSKAYVDKSVQCNREVDSILDLHRVEVRETSKTSKDEIFLPDYDLCADKKPVQMQKIDVLREKLVEKSKVSLKTDAKFFLMEEDSDDNLLNKKPEKPSNASSKFLRSRLERSPGLDEKVSKVKYFEETENKLAGISCLLSDFLRNLKETNQSGIVFDNSKKQKFVKIHESLTDLMKKVHRDHYLILHELLKKTMIKLDEQTLKTLNYHKLLCLVFEGYTKRNEGFIEYNINLEDVLMKKTWRFQIRYSKLRNFHRECQAFLDAIKPHEGEKGCLPPFPPKKWFGNTEDEFLKVRQKELENYFQRIMTSQLCQQIIEKGVLRYFLYKEIWGFESEEFKRRTEQVEKWEAICKRAGAGVEGKNNTEESLNYEKLAGLLKEEAAKVNARLEVAKADFESVEKNDSFTILKYEEKRRRLEKELSVKGSFADGDINDFKAILLPGS